MTSAGFEVPRADRVVIMARGQSSRMQVPKGLLRLNESGPVFLQVVADLYGAAGMPGDVVMRQEDAAAYGRLWKGSELTRTVVECGGGDTALTLLAAWRSWQEVGIPCTHVWAHPVDLPLVAPATVAWMWGQSRDHPQRMLRPRHNGVPGHPVILPVAVLEILAERAPQWPGPLREFLTEACRRRWLAEPLPVSVDDPGIVRDFDRPEDFNPDPQDRGAP